MRSRPLITLMVAFGLLCLPFMVTPSVSAETVYWCTFAPSANNATIEYLYPRVTTDPEVAPGAKVLGDTIMEHWYFESDIETRVYTDDFSNPTWHEYGSTSYIGTLPNSSAVIDSVFIMTMFTLYRPSLRLYYSVDGGGSWNYSEMYSSGYALKTWEVTSLEDWTYEMFEQPDFKVKMYCNPDEEVHYYLDYLGFWVSWHEEVEGESGGSEDPTEGTEEGDTPWSYALWEGGGIIGALGSLGFVGMIATPALAIWAWRNGAEDSKIALGIKALVMFMIFLSLFMASLSM